MVLHPRIQRSELPVEDTSIDDLKYKYRIHFNEKCFHDYISTRDAFRMILMESNFIYFGDIEITNQLNKKP